MSPKVVKIKEKLLPILRKNGVYYCAVFGSYARGEDKKGSDIDLLIDFGKRKLSLFDLADVKLKLEKALGRDVDIVLKGRIKPSLREYVEKDLITLYEKR